MALRIVFIHLGKAKASHLWSNIENILRTQPEISIDVITSYKMDGPPLLNSRINYYVYDESEEVATILDSLSMDKKFRQGFWRFSLERLFVLTAHHKFYPNDSLLHIESDILLLPNFPFDSFQPLTKPAWLKFDKIRDLAAVLYIPNNIKSIWLTEVMIQEIKSCEEINDMQLLNRISTKYPGEVTILPSSPLATANIFDESTSLDEKEKELVSANFNNFGGIFDPAAFGIWLTGSDPRNNFGITRRFDTKRLLDGETYIDPSKVTLEYSLGNGLYVNNNGARIKVFNLHIHSKNERLFDEGWEDKLSRLVKSSRLGRIQRTYSLRIFIGLVTSNYQNGTLLQFILWFPFLAPVRKFLIATKRILKELFNPIE